MVFNDLVYDGNRRYSATRSAKCFSAKGTQCDSPGQRPGKTRNECPKPQRGEMIEHPHDALSGNAVKDLIPQIREYRRATSFHGTLNPNGVPHGNCQFGFKNRGMWNPVGVRIDSNSLTWGAPQSDDPRLCCETRSGLNHTISLQIILHGVAFQGFDVRNCRFLGRCPRLSPCAALRQNPSDTQCVVTEQKPDQQTVPMSSLTASPMSGCRISDSPTSTAPTPSDRRRWM